MAFYNPPVNLHSPGPIGDVTPNTGAFTMVAASGGVASTFNTVYVAPSQAIKGGAGAVEWITFEGWFGTIGYLGLGGTNIGAHNARLDASVANTMRALTGDGSGTGFLRFKLVTSDPHVVGEPWNDGGSIAISAG